MYERIQLFACIARTQGQALRCWCFPRWVLMRGIALYVSSQIIDASGRAEKGAYRLRGLYYNHMAFVLSCNPQIIIIFAFDLYVDYPVCLLICLTFRIHVIFVSFPLLGQWAAEVLLVEPGVSRIASGLMKCLYIYIEYYSCILWVFPKISIVSRVSLNW